MTRSHFTRRRRHVQHDPSTIRLFCVLVIVVIRATCVPSSVYPRRAYQLPLALALPAASGFGMRDNNDCLCKFGCERKIMRYGDKVRASLSFTQFGQARCIHQAGRVHPRQAQLYLGQQSIQTLSRRKLALLLMIHLESTPRSNRCYLDVSSRLNIANTPSCHPSRSPYPTGSSTNSR